MAVLWPLQMFRLSFFILFFLYVSLACASEKVLSRNQYIDIWKDEAIYQMAVHKIPASITLAQGILESGDGNSRLAREGNNHFGIKCHNDWTGDRIYEDDETKGECFRKYNDAKDSYEDHSLFLQRKRYEKLFDLHIDDYRAWAKGLKECGYATNPTYPQLLIRIIEEFKLHEYDEQGEEFIRKNKIPGRNEKLPEPNITAGSDKHRREKRNARNSTQDEERLDITIHSGRKIELSDNRIKFTLAGESDTQESIARDLDIHVSLLRKYNDFKKDDTLKPGQIVYLQPKRNQGSSEQCTVQKGEGMKEISQKYGIKLKKLYKLNQLTPGQEPDPGTTLKLKR